MWSSYHVSPSLLMVIYEMKSTFRQYRSNASCIKASYSSKLHFWTFWNVYSGNGSLAMWSSVSCARCASGLTISPGTMDFISVSTSREQLLPRLSIVFFYFIFSKQRHLIVITFLLKCMIYDSNIPTDNFMFFWPCIMNWLYINYQLDALIIIYS